MSISTFKDIISGIAFLLLMWSASYLFLLLG